MKIKICVGILALAFAYGCSAKKSAAPASETPPVAATTVVNTPVEEKFAITTETLAEGKSLYEMNCAKCHKLFAANDFTAEEWTPIVLRMQKKARISDEHREKIYAYLTTP